MQDVTSDYCYVADEPLWPNQCLRPLVREILLSYLKPDDKIMDVGCGSGATA